MRNPMYKCVGALLVIASLSIALVSADEQQPEKGKGKKDKGKSEPEIVQVDLNKLPPEIAKAIRDQTAAPKQDKGKDKKDKKDKKGDVGSKSISLSDAIRIAEKSGFGTAVKAERKGESGDYHFKVDVLDKTGAKSKIKLDATGKLLEEKKGDDKKGKGKDKKK